MTSLSSTSLTHNEKRLVQSMQLLGDKTRYKIFKLLLSNQQLCVSEIAKQLDISVSAVSQHFRGFEDFGLVDRQRFGQKICYKINTDDAFIKQLTQLIKEGHYV